MNWILSAFARALNLSPVERDTPLPPLPSENPETQRESEAMRIVVDRNLSDTETTLSDVYVDGDLVCHGLEDERRTVKIWGETRIPAGIYRVDLRKFGGFHERYSKNRRTAAYHEGMLWVRDVPGFEAILIHIGNSEKDTAGCLLVGMSRDEKNMKLWLSAAAYEKLYKQVVNAARQGLLSIEYRDNDGAVS